MRPRVNLCLFNHPWQGILDQIWFIEQVLVQNGYEVLCSNTLRPDRLNLLIENFIETDAHVLESFCNDTGKQIGVIMTEHIEVDEQMAVTFAGAALSDDTYIGNKEQRFFSLISIARCVFAFFTLGELPELVTWRRLLPGFEVHHLPYPVLVSEVLPPSSNEFDVVFTGTLTPYRSKVLAKLRKSHRVLHSAIQETEEQRASLYARAKVAVNIPQSDEWRWASPMRALFGLRHGKATVHWGPSDGTAFGNLVLRPVSIEDAVDDPRGAFELQRDAYADLARRAQTAPFPSGLFNVWARAEGLA